MHEELLKAALAEIQKKMEGMNNMLFIAVDNKNPDKLRTTGGIIGDSTELSYCLFKLMEKEPIILALVTAAYEIYKKYENKATQN